MQVDQSGCRRMKVAQRFGAAEQELQKLTRTIKGSILGALVPVRLSS